MNAGSRPTNICDDNAEPIALPHFLPVHKRFGDRSFREFYRQTRVLCCDKSPVAIRSCFGGLLRPSGSESSNECGDNSDADLTDGEIIKPLRGVALSNIGGCGQVIATETRFVGGGAALACLAMAGIWLLDTERRVAGSLRLLLLALAPADV
ncbi:MAG TPA: hypothetical protein VFW39_12930 [Sphingomicrobium sp.]|nr:hypothetical protein [Sphingomicrobium sp.]